MALYTNNGDKINTAALFDVLDAMEDAEKIDAGRLYGFVCDSFLIVGPENERENN